MQEREAALLREHGHEVERFTVDNAEIARIGSVRSGAKAVWNRQACREARKMIDAFQPDIAHVHTPFPILSPAIFRATRAAGVPTVATMHSYRYTCINALLYRDGQVCHRCVGKRTSWPAVVNRCYKGSATASAAMAGSLALHHVLGTFRNCVDAFITLTEFARQKLIDDRFPAEKIIVKPNFVVSDGTPGEGEGGFALFVGRLVPEKGVRALIDAWVKLGPSAPALKIVGDGPLREELEKAATDAAIEVEFVGWKETPEVLSLMRQAEFLVFPSEWYEAGCTLVMMEAFSCGTPVLASDVGNFSEAIRPGETGGLFRCGDADDLAAQVRALAGSRQGFTKMREHCFAEYENRYSPESNYKMLMDIYGRFAGHALGIVER